MWDVYIYIRKFLKIKRKKKKDETSHYSGRKDFHELILSSYSEPDIVQLLLITLLNFERDLHSKNNPGSGCFGICWSFLLLSLYTALTSQPEVISSG